MSRARQRANHKIKVQAETMGIKNPEFIRPKGSERQTGIQVTEKS